MSKRSFTAAALALSLSTGAALAADLPNRKAPPYLPPPPMMWTGFYGGLNLGGAWSANSNSNSNWALYTDPGVAGSVIALPGWNNGANNNNGGLVGGGQIGYNRQFGSSIVVGAEADIQGTTMGSRANNGWATWPSPLGTGNLLVPLTSQGNVGVSWFGTVRGRAGYLVMPTLLVYGTGGFAYGGVSGRNQTSTRTGWTAGGGVEWMFAPNWSAKAEYLFVDLDSGGRTGTFGWNWGNRRHPQVNVVRAGVNYHFNWGSAPILAKF